MAIIPEFYLNSVLSIGVETSQIVGGIAWIGSGFFVVKKLGNNTTTARVFVVTNRHVLEGKKAVTLRLKKKDGQFIKNIHTLTDSNDVPCYSTSDNPKIDVAAFSFVGGVIEREGLNVGFLDIDEAAVTTEEFIQGGGGEGSLIYMLGYPMGLVDTESNTPVCRLGCVARIDEHEVLRDKKILLDIQNFPGNSGSPILTRPEVISIGGTTPFDKCKLMGIINSYIPYRDVLVSRQTGEAVEIRTENSGIANCIPVQYIRQVVDKEMNKYSQ